MVCILFFLYFSVFTFFPFFHISWFTYERMFNVFSSVKTVLTKCYILTSYTFIDGFILFNLFKPTSITVVIITYTNFFNIHCVFDLILFDFNFHKGLISFLISTKWTFDNSIIFELIFHPLRETIQMESISAYICTCCNSITFDYLHMTNST